MKKESISVTTPDEASAGVPPAIGRQSVPHCGEITVRNRGRLPHWEKECGTYFVTFRLADSLPAHVLDRNEADLEHALDYVEQNPSKAGLGDWRFVWRWGANSHTTAARTAALP